MLAIWTILYDSKKVAGLKDDLYLWEIDNAGEKVEKKIRFGVKYITIYIVATVLAALCGSILFAVNLSHDLEWFFVLRFIKDYFPDKYLVLAILYKATFIFSGYSMIVHVLQIIYYTQHLRYQIMLLNEYIVNISDCSLNIDEKKLFDDEEYQATIENRLKFCIRRWDEYLL